MHTASIAQDQIIPYQQPIDKVPAAFGAEAHRGLSPAEAREKYG